SPSLRSASLYASDLRELRLNQPTMAGFCFGCARTASIHASNGHAAAAMRNARRVEWRPASGRTRRREPATLPTPSSPYRRHYMRPVLAGLVALLREKAQYLRGIG